MMKNLTLFFFLLLFQYQGNAQETLEGKFDYKATYRLTFQMDSTNRESVKSESMFLYLGDEGSRFSSAGKAIKDSLMANRDKSDKSRAALMKMRSQIPESAFDYSIYKNYTAGEQFYTEEVVKDDFLYPDDLALFSWEISPEQREVSGFQAQKATTSFAGRDYTAWFTSEIPIPDGPYKFNGLPGLILEVSDTQEHYVFELMQFEELKEPIGFELVPKDFITTTESKFLEVKRDYDRDPIAALERVGITIGFKPGQRERMHKEHLRELKKKNNPIELE